MSALAAKGLVFKMLRPQRHPEALGLRPSQLLRWAVCAGMTAWPPSSEGVSRSQGEVLPGAAIRGRATLSWGPRSAHTATLGGRTRCSARPHFPGHLTIGARSSPHLCG